MRITALATLALGLGLAACQGSSKPSEPPSPSEPRPPVLARTPGGDFTEADLREILARLPHNATPPDARQVFDRAIEIELLAAEARRRGYDRRVDVEWQVKNLLASTMLKEDAARIRARAEAMSDEDAHAYYLSHLAAFSRPEQVRASYVVVDDGPAAQALATRAREGADFAQLARDAGMTETNVAGQEWFDATTSQLPPAIAATLFEPHAVDEILGPYASDGAHYVVRFLERRATETQPYERVRSEIARVAARDQIRTEKEALLARLRSPVVIDEAAVTAALADPSLVSQAPESQPRR